MTYINLPEYVRPCGVCKGEGEYDQQYTAGCGGGYFSSKGSCRYCQREGQDTYLPGVGYVYKDERMGEGGVPESVMAQIVNMNKVEWEDV